MARRHRLMAVCLPRDEGDRLAVSLEACNGSTPAAGDLARVSYLLRDAQSKLAAFRWAYRLLLAVGLLLWLLNLGWPAVVWAAPRLGSNPCSAGVPSVCFTAGLIFLCLYAQYKSRARRVEDAIRHTLCTEEDLATKIERLIAVTEATDQGLRLPSVRADSGERAENGTA